jgi:hypothetical protein
MADSAEGYTRGGEPMPRYLYRKISLELLHQYPGHVFLRLESWAGPASLIEVAPGDLVNISKLADREPGSGERVTRVTAPGS